MPLPTVLALITLLVGFIVSRRRLVSPHRLHQASLLLIRVFYPCLILGSLPNQIQGDSLLTLWPLPLSAALLLLLGYGVGLRLLRWSQLRAENKQRSFVFLAILPNYSYLPLLVAQALWGERAMIFVMLSSIGADLVLWTVGLRALSQQPPRQWRQLLNPPLLALLFSLALMSDAGHDLRLALQSLFPLLKSIGSATIPLSTLLLGAHFAKSQVAADDARAQSLLLAWRLLVAPALVFIVLLLVGLPPLVAQVILLVASMPGAIVSVVLSERYAASPQLAARHIFLGHIAWLASGSFWLWLGQRAL